MRQALSRHGLTTDVSSASQSLALMNGPPSLTHDDLTKSTTIATSVIPEHQVPTAEVIHIDTKFSADVAGITVIQNNGNVPILQKISDALINNTVTVTVNKNCSSDAQIGVIKASEDVSVNNRDVDILQTQKIVEPVTVINNVSISLVGFFITCLLAYCHCQIDFMILTLKN